MNWVADSFVEDDDVYDKLWIIICWILYFGANTIYSDILSPVCERSDRNYAGKSAQYYDKNVTNVQESDDTCLMSFEHGIYSIYMMIFTSFGMIVYWFTWAQNELIAHYGYIPEEHSTITQDGYILTMFRCNSKKFASKKGRKAVIIQHGLLSSSDEFCVNDPSQGLGE